MKTALLFSGGKDSNFALYIAKKCSDVKVLINLEPINLDSYMFQYTEREFLLKQSKVLGIPLIVIKTKGNKESELNELQIVLKKAIQEYEIEGVISGAIYSTYQAIRIQKICLELNIWSINPLWQIDERNYLKNLLKRRFMIRIVKIASFPFDKNILGHRLNNKIFEKLLAWKRKYKISLIGEGGEFETIVTDSPLYRERIFFETEQIEQLEIKNYSGKVNIKKIKLIKKKNFVKSPFKPWISENEVEYDNLFTIKRDFILIIDLNSSLNPLSKYEYVRPISDIIIKSGFNRECIKIIHKRDILVLDEEELKNLLKKVSKIILSGTALKDFNYIDDVDSFQFLKKFKKPILTICAGTQLIAKLFGFSIEDRRDIALKRGEVKNYDSIIENLGSSIKLYTLYQKRPLIKFQQQSQKYKVKVILIDNEGYAQLFKIKNNIYCATYHPEVSTKRIISNFIKL